MNKNEGTGDPYPMWEPNRWQWVPEPYYPPYIYPPTTNTSVYMTDPTVTEKLEKIIELLEKLIESQDKRQEN